MSRMIRHANQPEEFLPIPRPCYSNVSRSVWLYKADCLTVLDALAAKHPNGCFDMIFADPPYFLSNGGITCHAGRMVRVDKGDWDKSRGVRVTNRQTVNVGARCISCRDSKFNSHFKAA